MRCLLAAVLPATLVSCSALRAHSSLLSSSSAQRRRDCEHSSPWMQIRKGPAPARACSGIFSICIFKGGRGLCESGWRRDNGTLPPSRLRRSAPAGWEEPVLTWELGPTVWFQVSFLRILHVAFDLPQPPSAAPVHYPAGSRLAVTPPRHTSPRLIHLRISLFTLSRWIVFSRSGGKVGWGSALPAGQGGFFFLFYPRYFQLICWSWAIFERGWSQNCFWVSEVINPSCPVSKLAVIIEDFKSESACRQVQFTRNLLWCSWCLINSNNIKKTVTLTQIKNKNIIITARHKWQNNRNDQK